MGHTFTELASLSQKRRRDSSSLDSEPPLKRLASDLFPEPRYASTLIRSGTVHCATNPPCNSSFTSSCDASSNDLSRDISHTLDSSGGLNGGNCTKTPCVNAEHSHFVPHTNQPVPPEPSLYEELHNLFHTLWSGQRTVVSPSNLLYAVWTTLPTFKGYKQQDAQEFLSLLLDRLQAELHGIPPHLVTGSRDFINRTFQGYSISHIRCSVCHLIACTEEPVYELSLSLPPNCYSGEITDCDLVDLLRQFVSPTQIDGASYACQQCNRRCTKKPGSPVQYRLDKESEFNLDSCISSHSSTYPGNLIFLLLFNCYCIRMYAMVLSSV